MRPYIFDKCISFLVTGGAEVPDGSSHDPEGYCELKIIAIQVINFPSEAPH